MHDSELWPERRWAIFMPPHKNGVIEARPFKSEKERDAWVSQNSGMRQAVGKRHPAVKALRQEWVQRERGEFARCNPHWPERMGP